MDFAANLGINLDSSRDRNLAIALGGLTNGVTPLQMATAYSAFANLGVWNETYAINKIVDRDGNVVYAHKNNQKTVMTQQDAYWMTEMLRTVVQSGTGRAASMARPVAGKTGTTQINVVGAPSNANRDAWFVGYTPEWSAAIWMGFDQTTEKNYMLSGSSATARLFSTFMSNALSTEKIVPFPKPANVTSYRDEKLETPKDVTGQYKTALNGVTLSWSEVKSATSYEIYRMGSDESSYSLLGKTSGTTLLDAEVFPEMDYEYYVIAKNDSNMKSKQSNTIYISVPALADGTDPNLIPSASPSASPTSSDSPTGGSPTPTATSSPTP
jgi:penicillin-binding protein 2A